MSIHSAGEAAIRRRSAARSSPAIDPPCPRLRAVGIEPANLSQQLAVLRRMGLVTTRKDGSAVFYSLTSPQVAELLAVARRILTEVLSG